MLDKFRTITNACRLVRENKPTLNSSNVVNTGNERYPRRPNEL